MVRPGATFDGLDDPSAMHQVVKKLLKVRDAEIFRAPVPWKEMGLEDYPKIIKRPMDLGTVASNIDLGTYETDMEVFWTDLEQIWKNCEMYNGKDTQYGKIAGRFRDHASKTKSQVEARGATAERRVSASRPISPRTRPTSSRAASKFSPAGEDRHTPSQTPATEPISVVTSSHETVSRSVLESAPSSTMPFSSLPPTSEPRKHDIPQPEGEPSSKIEDPRAAAIAAAVAVRTLQLNPCGLAILLRYILNLQASRSKEQIAEGPLLRHVPKKHPPTTGLEGKPANDDLLRLDMGRLMLHELKAVYQFIERLIDSGLVHQFDAMRAGEHVN